jgi:hypothetical protein
MRRDLQYLAFFAPARLTESDFWLARRIFTKLDFKIIIRAPTHAHVETRQPN